MCGANLPATQQNAIRSANVECFTQRSNLCEGSIGLLDEIGRERAADGMQKRRSDEPANHHSNDGRGESRMTKMRMSRGIMGVLFKDTRNEVISFRRERRSR